MAARLSRAQVAYVGISLDGIRETHDRFRGQAGAYDAALSGLRACREAGIKVGLRVTLTRANAADIPAIFDLLEAEQIPRICFYHLVPAGRGAALASLTLDARQARDIVDGILDRTAELDRRGVAVEVLTVDNHCDGPWLCLRMLREGNPRAREVLDLLRRVGGNSSGDRIGCVSWDGTVYPDQFWRTRSLGNVRKTAFSRIWTDPTNELLSQLRDKPRHVTGRCVPCRFLDVCGGNLRARAEAATGDPWGVDPGCYLTDDEIRREED
jgi:radical SAM protein with 4Fe4S-binding SPASM domain